jgi:hypothetical protein
VRQSRRFTAASISVAAKAWFALVGVVKFMPSLQLSARSMVDYKRKSPSPNATSAPCGGSATCENGA